ncbi:hypothetical protein KP509_30G025400 [Ceratopteris richardii]|uniref:Pentatricopeptide repeat-containing protein n=1 Tax=Ceratopteris richardii TaxID=49495 RepID=A0A8T2R2C5_CERRI|nr:hypothetical protein KP509_30G025400 [Ceratopteris richardii]KAH7289955.1 hypothetical protein KP509_30G025400 [Ceratopteris richardii]
MIRTPAKAAGQRCPQKEQLVGLPTVSTSTNQDIPDEVTLVSILRACAILKDTIRGRKIHTEICKRGLHISNVFIGNTLVNMYAKCGALQEARQVLNELLHQDTVSWTALIAGYCQYGYAEEALVAFEEMQGMNIYPNALTFTCILKACGMLPAQEKGQEIHIEIARHGMLERDVVLGSALVDMYAKCGALAKAQEVFKGLPVCNVVSWTSLIAGYCQYGCADEALACLRQMEQYGPPPNETTFTCILNACASMGSITKSQQMHGKIVKLGFLTNTCELGNALVDMYIKCGVFSKAQQLFNDLPIKDIVSWTTLITGYGQHGYIEEALQIFDQMKREGISSNAVTLTCILNACGNTQAAQKGKGIHAEIIKGGLLKANIMLGNALVDMYAKCASPIKAQQVFNELSSPNLVSWTSLIAGYCQNGYGEEALYFFQRMKEDGFSPDIVTLACILRACGCIGAAEKGREIHAEIIRAGLLLNSSILRSSLLDMYIKIGALARAREVYSELQYRDVVSMNALIAGYCQQGLGEKAIECFEKFKHEGYYDAVTFLCLLKAFGRMGAAGMGQTYYEAMTTNYGIFPTIEHHICMVDLFCRSGYFHKALALIQTLPHFDYNQSCFVLLGACQRLGNTNLARLAFQCVSGFHELLSCSLSQRSTSI